MQDEQYWPLKQQLVQVLSKEADALRLAAELFRTGSLSHPWIMEVLRSAELNRTERMALVDRLNDGDPP